MNELEIRVNTVIEAIRNRLGNSHFSNELGLELEEFKESDICPVASFIYRKKDNHLNNYDALHGGIVASIFDTAMGLGAAGLSNSKVTTTEMSVSFLRPAMGDCFRTVVEYGHVGSNLVHATAKLYAVNGDSGEEILCATSQGGYFILRMELE